MNLIIDLNSSEKWLTHLEYIEPLIRCIKNSKVVNRCELDKINLDNVKHIILSGTPLMEIEYLNDAKLMDWIGETNIPILGICAGMQIMGKAYGGKTFGCEEIGMTEVHTVKPNILFENNFKSYSLHNLALEKSETYTVLAESEKCIQAIKHNAKQHYGVLFHPEIRNQEIISNFLKL